MINTSLKPDGASRGGSSTEGKLTVTELCSQDLPQRIALFFTPSRVGGGVGKSLLNLAGAFAERGHHVDLILSRAEGPYLQQVSSAVKLIVLKPTPGGYRRLQALLSAEYRGVRAALLSLLLARTFRYLPDLIRYLQQQRPTILFSAKTYPNLAALWARRLAKVPTRVMISERTSLSHEISQRAKKWQWHWQLLPGVIRQVYPWADAIVAVSNGVADDLSLTTGLPRERIATLYNPVVSAELLRQAQIPPEHPWFGTGGPPMVLAAGRLEEQKDFPTLLAAFAQVRTVRKARLVILGEGKQRGRLEALTRKLGVSADVDLPGFVTNPFAYMACAKVFVLSSAFEGLPGVLIQAMACGCSVVSTNCPSGPAEILDGGKYGPLVPVGDTAALAKAILTVLDAPLDPEQLRARASLFSIDHAADQCLDLVLIAAATSSGFQRESTPQKYHTHAS